VNTIAGIIQIKGNTIKRIVLEGHLEVKHWKFDVHNLASLEITPYRTTIRHRGQLTATFTSAGVLGLTTTDLILNAKTTSLEGDIAGVFRIYAGPNLVIDQSTNVDIEVKGRLNFYISPISDYIQGSASIQVKFGISLRCEGAFFVGFRAPTDKIWALDHITKGPSIRTTLKGQNRNLLTGAYVAGKFSGGVHFAIFDGKFSIWTGLGFFGPNIIDDKGNPDFKATFLGHAGLELRVGILAGLISARAYAELLAMMTFPLNFNPEDLKVCLQGTLGVEACAIIFCVNWQGSVHIDDTGVDTGACYSSE
jgi:hypothetical protein